MEHKILVHSHVGSDGILKLEVPTEFKDADLEVTSSLLSSNRRILGKRKSDRDILI